MAITHSLGQRTVASSIPAPLQASLLIISLAFCATARAQIDQAHPPSSTANPKPTLAPQNSGSHGGSRAEVSFHGDLLTVVANNSSLNQVLREVARQTGMKIVGGVGEERVFGTYGPASPGTILATLLDGTGSNLLIVQNASNLPTELILTRRTGGVTPPDPNARSAEEPDAEDDSSEAVNPAAPGPTSPPTNSRAPNRPGTGGMDRNPAATAPSSTSQQLMFPPIDSSTPPSTATTTPTTPDPVADPAKTPQQIFEQLQRLRQQQTQQTEPQPQ